MVLNMNIKSPVSSARQVKFRCYGYITLILALPSFPLVPLPTHATVVTTINALFSPDQGFFFVGNRIDQGSVYYTFAYERVVYIVNDIPTADYTPSV